MQIVIADSEFQRLGLIENANVIWTSRYYKTGDFELYMPATADNLALIEQGKYVINDDDEDNIGVIEDLTIEGNAEDGDMMTVTGRFALGHYLSKRIVPTQTQLYGNVELQVRSLVYDNIVEPVDKNRKIPFIVLGARDESITEKIELQTTGDNLLEKVEEICESKGIGMRMPLRDGLLYFEMYKGIDRSYKQEDNSWIVFSDDYDNLQDVAYTKTTTEAKNFAYVAGEGEGTARMIVTTYNTEEEPTGADRSEVWVDQRNASSNDGEISESELEAQLKEDGNQELSTITEAFDGTVLFDNFDYGKPDDGGAVYMGDMVTIQKTKWNGIYINARIVEVIESSDENGTERAVTFGV